MPKRISGTELPAPTHLLRWDVQSSHGLVVDAVVDATEHLRHQGLDGVDQIARNVFDEAEGPDHDPCSDGREHRLRMQVLEQSLTFVTSDTDVLLNNLVGVSLVSPDTPHHA